MDLQKIKEDLNQAGFSSNGLGFINAVMDEAIGRGKLEKTEKDKIRGIIDIEIETAKIVANAKKEIANELNEYADNLDAAIAEAADDLEALNKSLPNQPKSGGAE